MIIDKGLALAIVAFLFYIVGGLATFFGIGVILVVGKNDLWGWGQGTGIAYLFICVGLCLSVLGVLFMRIFRNRGPF